MPTLRMGENGEWREYQAIHPKEIQEGTSLLIIWDMESDSVRTTLTSQIVEILPESQEN